MRVFTHTRTHSLPHRHPLLFTTPPPPPEGKSGSQVAAERAPGLSVTQEASAALPQILSVVIRRHVIDVNLVAFLGNGKESGCVKGSISERGPCTGRPRLLRRACGDDGSKIKTHKSV